ncbi:hypothetical protein BMR05_09085 [Methylococcaceae bacterium HT4]|uniref:hypothetical protein n=1 Tax=Bathymodiolus platifrons methanotrophic gill symbiont TaxID=113268 RepID=UPI000B417195|nr:hypothetical protein [Bathymodiolus platifrons methanotrophic gill symbiont]MCK5869587.1 hypothetical protein [Methyloprofundus sp.]TXK99275.1 hypothetical protein BMR10_00930 [Methylococcaceae bacterium CS4]TXL07416.1 hypothetical protein BMR07_04605 [Methylococcaceae bacterium CS1]TXL12032.1 hypothetical protein BMR08_01760 [Methylococcaceae bacterium CS2]TXL13999.1 hypothetical protein BMR05_09085 [Methylococcaceae bacterium HT4]TXL19746.1 hypothetical protein BMR06_08485 [Methylococcac
MLSALGSSWQPAKQNTPQAKTKRPLPVWLRWTGKVLSYSFVIAIIYDLSRMFPEVTEILTHLSP